ncbi:MAG: hypothetical protein JW772_02575 [Candidatus Diapherotrites archaeon]|nr:hypothetical protein [Candidatus Diapherotrites archaeon]
MAKQRRRREYFEPEVSPGELYKKIIVSRDEFDKGEKALTKRTEPYFVKLCKSVYKRFPSGGKGATYSTKYQEAIDFLRWDLKPEEFSATVKVVMILVMGLGIAIGFGLLFSPVYGILLDLVNLEFLIYMYIFAPIIIVALFATVFVQQYPLNAAKTEQTMALGYVPEIVGYMIMSMKLVPNLEKAVEFAAEHGRGKIASDFRRLLWETQIGLFTSLSEGLDDLAYRWGRFSDEFKHALMMVRASVLENTEAKRYQLLDKTMETVLDSIRTKMEQYARNLSQPSTLLFYVGVLLPLILIIILPVGSAFSGAPMAKPEILIGIYNIGIPILTFIFAMQVIKQRPPTYTPPKIPDNYPNLPKKGRMLIGKSTFDYRFLAIIILIVGISLSVFVSQEGIPPKSLIDERDLPYQIIPADPTEANVLLEEKGDETFFDEGGKRYQELISEGKTPKTAKALLAMEKQKFFMEAGHDVTPYKLVFGSIIAVAIAAFIFIYYANIYKRRIQQQIIRMENEFQDSLYVLASRLGENKPVEEALKHTKNFLPSFIISQRIFARIVENIELLGMPLEQAVFDKNYGALKNLPSNVIQSSMKILVDSVGLGVNVAARTLISLSLQLSNAQKVNKMLSDLIADVVSMMKTMVIFIAPIVLGVTTSLQKVVMLTLAGIASSGALEQVGGAGDVDTGFSVPLQGISFEAFSEMVTPVGFLIIVTIYVIELVVIMSYFTTKIEEDNDLLVRLNIAKALPVAVIVFLVAVLASNMVVGSFFGGG